MRVLMAFWCPLMLLGAIFAATGSDLNEKVTLHQVGIFSGCPGEAFVLVCSVQSDFLQWQCDSTANRFLICNNRHILPMLCQSQEARMTVHCDNSDRRRITSTLILTIPTNTMMLTCRGNMTISEDMIIPVPPPPVENVHVKDKRKSMDDANSQVVTVSWDESTTGQPKNYKVSVEPGVEECNNTCVINKTYMELKLAVDTAYNVTITTVVCNDSVQSKESQPLLIKLSGSTSGGTSSKVAMSIVSVILIVLLVTVCRKCSLRSILRRRIQARDTVQQGQLQAPVSHQVPIQELAAAQERYNQVQAAFEGSSVHSGRAPLKMEAGRSVVHESETETYVYFAPYMTMTLFRYSVNKEEWNEETMPYSNPGLAIIDGSVATIGGQTRDGRPTNEVWLLKGHQWKKYIKSMIDPVSDPAVVTSPEHDYIVVIGGNVCTGFNISSTSTVEVCDLKKTVWRQVRSLPSPHTRFEVTLCNDVLYVFPDQYPAGYKCTLNALIEDPNAHWTTIKGTPLRLSTPTNFEGYVICVGGANDERFGLDEIYMYDEAADSWNKTTMHLERGRMYSMVETHNRKVIVVGGISELTPDRRTKYRLDEVEIFDSSCT